MNRVARVLEWCVVASERGCARGCRSTPEHLREDGVTRTGRVAPAGARAWWPTAWQERSTQRGGWR
jgi:hypothetical protein